MQNGLGIYSRLGTFSTSKSLLQIVQRESRNEDDR
jgi:hypothetical protein